MRVPYKEGYYMFKFSNNLHKAPWYCVKVDMYGGSPRFTFCGNATSFRDKNILVEEAVFVEVSFPDVGVTE